jgi:hypothetical protein
VHPLRARVAATKAPQAKPKAQIAERMGVGHQQAIHTWRRRYPDFPAPVARLRQALIWNWPDVERWARATGRLPRRSGS